MTTTPEQVVDQAFFLFAPDDADYDAYQVRRAELLRTIHTALEDSAHKASQYDDVVKALNVADGGKYRNDTIETLLTRLQEAEELADHVERLLGGEEKLGLAARALLNRARKMRKA